ncbi:hypothetical protein A3C26_00960 [Candidatus Daviesbacteria bacterium RIFCSPHIGHO2_02_FULL_39_12]|uniref:Bro-N domain-containing protein n=2 Tax=Candidatus Daviesiibacteriota TaxID=1752718 RepID=A0A1F5JDI4_9BACT|nr:MAG: hypothetical protein A3C26_00960 [Candidatus Daviesbacteria bacterium RIFCSPHIGHO2_02_FULL_39_12]OGE72625.1 MAG: hypothetical protein A3H40_01035 [Candidatus Daviesbacteria bacterium RIFCSPLOWO2_02_FULL_38_15]
MDFLLQSSSKTSIKYPVSKSTKIAIFEGRKIRRHWDEQFEKWYFSVVDVIAALSNSTNPQVYWRVLKKRLLDEGANETVTKCNGLKMLAADGKIEQLRVITSLLF